jgi:hypothetical protein
MSDADDVCPAQHPDGKGGCGRKRDHDIEHAVFTSGGYASYHWPNPEGAARIAACEQAEKEAAQRAERHWLVFLAALVGGAEVIRLTRADEKEEANDLVACALALAGGRYTATAASASAVYRPPEEPKS